MARPKMEEERKAQILDALETMVLRDGLAQLTLAKVAQEAKLPRSLLRYFAGNKTDLILLLFERMIERGEAKIEGLTTSQQDELSVEQVLDLVLDELLGDENLSVMVDELWPYAALDRRIQERLRGLYQRLCQELVDRMSSELIGADDDDRFRRAYGIVAMGFGATFFSDISFVPRDPDTIRNVARELLRPNLST
ncbi:TetR/AcrR family transcriptional regulator [Ruegeria pomeroyi]|nr:TetR/AcrR family transcriptional regulator [Ruegeria pomeroyi]